MAGWKFSPYGICGLVKVRLSVQLPPPGPKLKPAQLEPLAVANPAAVGTTTLLTVPGPVVLSVKLCGELAKLVERLLKTRRVGATPVDVTLAVEAAPGLPWMGSAIDQM